MEQVWEPERLAPDVVGEAGSDHSRAGATGTPSVRSGLGGRRASRPSATARPIERARRRSPASERSAGPSDGGLGRATAGRRLGAVTRL
jgi:hypothetical protein